MSCPPPQPADATPPLTVFIATSRRFYPEAEALCEVLRGCGVRVFHPYFDRDARAIEADPELKVAVTREHFPELDGSDVVYALLPGGYTGTSVAMELAYAFAKGKRVVTSEPSAEFAVRAVVDAVIPPEDFPGTLSGPTGRPREPSAKEPKEFPRPLR
jgi:nucleoside 2-deoxyribosyltransferase